MTYHNLRIEIRSHLFHCTPVYKQIYLYLCRFSIVKKHTESVYTEYRFLYCVYRILVFMVSWSENERTTYSLKFVAYILQLVYIRIPSPSRILVDAVITHPCGTVLFGIDFHSWRKETNIVSSVSCISGKKQQFLL